MGDQLSVPSTMESLCGEEKDDTACCVCSDGNFEENNLIVFCDGCNIAVHQLCYGITEVPDGPYLCSHCMSMEPAAQVRHAAAASVVRVVAGCISPRRRPALLKESHLFLIESHLSDSAYFALKLGGR